MLEVIHDFVSTLRKAGVRVSPSEAIDAARAAQAVGVERRDQLRLALRAAMAKTREDASRFDRTFDKFFKTPPVMQRGQGREAAGETGGGRGRSRSVQDDDEIDPGVSRSGGRPSSPPRLRRGRLKVILDKERRASRVPDRSAGRAQMPPPPRTSRPAASNRSEPSLRPPLRPSSPRSRPSRRPRPLPRVAHPRSGPRVELASGGEPTDPRRLDLTAPLTSAEEELVAREVPRLIQEIRLKTGRRYRQSSTGRPWPTRLMRRNIGTGGVPFVIPHRQRRPRRPRVVVLADVSWSVMRSSAFFLMMASAFVTPRRSTRRASVYLFVDRCAEATRAVARWEGPERLPFAKLLDSIEGLDPKAPSDYGRAIYQTIGSGGRSLRLGGRDTVLVVLGDARTNYRDPQAWAFEELASRCRRVIWLNPEPAARWDTGDSALASYLPSCDIVCEASDLEGIARGVAELAKSL